MKKPIAFFLMLILALSALGTIAAPVYAKNGSPTVKIAPNAQLNNSYTFEELGYVERIMIGPYDTTDLFFSLPANVKLAPGSTVSLTFSQSYSGGSTSSTLLENSVGGTLLVYFNDVLIDTIILDTLGEISREIPIPERAFLSTREDGRHRLELFLNADVNCNRDDLNTTLLISRTSRVNLQFQGTTPPVDLSILPRPLYQADSLLPSKALIVIPDNPEDYELQAGLTVATGLGAVSEGKLLIDSVTNSQLTQDMLAADNLVFVGLAQKQVNLHGANFPIPITENGMSLQDDNDGVIQTALSPWNNSNVAYFVGGNTQDGVIKAGQAFSTGKVVAVQQPDLSIVKQVNPSKDETVGMVDRTFKDLGYASQTMGIFGDNYLTYDFYVAQSQVGAGGAYVDLNVAYSELLDTQKTGISVILNDEIIGGIRFAEGESNSITHIEIGPEFLRRGMNRLELISSLVPYYTCYSTDLTSTWATISEESLIHLPVSTQTAELAQRVDLSGFPNIFVTEQSLNDLAFVVAKDDPISWNIAMKVANYIGAIGNVPLVALNAVYADQVTDAIRNNDSIIIVGRASKLPLIAEMGSALPAPFSSGTDEAVQPAMLVNYSLLPNTSVGYLQLLTSPWNAEKTVLAIMGNTDDGIPMAGNALVDPTKLSLLSGNFSILYGDQILTTDTRFGVSREGLVGQLGDVVVTSTPVPPASPSVANPTPEPQVEGRPAWILPVFIGITVIILILLVVVILRESKKRFSPEETSKNE